MRITMPLCEGPPLHHLIAMDFQVFLVLSASQNLVLVDKIEDQRIKEVPRYQNSMNIDPSRSYGIYHIIIQIT